MVASMTHQWLLRSNVYMALSYIHEFFCYIFRAMNSDFWVIIKIFDNKSVLAMKMDGNK